MLIHSASQLITIAGAPQRGAELGRLGVIEDGAVLIKGDTIADVGSSQALRTQYPDESTLDISGRVVMPGFVDPHTHAIWAGDRSAEFEMRLQGKSYMEIMAAGGGIASTVRATRAASLKVLMNETRQRLQRMFSHGTTTAEVKTGYGLHSAAELRMLLALLRLDLEGPLEIAATFLGAHAVAPEYQGRTDDYVTLVCDTMLPLVKGWWHNHAPFHCYPFVDVFCEKGVFDLDQSRRILEASARLGFPLKIHADEFANIGGASLAVALNAISADHLVATSAEDIQMLAQSNTVAVALPCTPFGLAESHYTPAREILEAGGLLAIATDLNPGTAWCESMQFAIALACRYLHLTPAQAIAAATINAAAAIDRSDRIGSLEPGKQADLIVLDIPDYRHLGYRFGTNLVQTVIKKGRIYPI
ncbi:MAG: imidazolonepropionase [Anaerolineales bacterium]|nr:imidazolonepropionase [Anaerolineales bacterium]